MAELVGYLQAQGTLNGFVSYTGSRAPYIGEDGRWYIYDTTEQEYADSGITASGPPGKGLDILGTYDNLAALTVAVPSPAQGDVYNVGPVAPYNIYMWDSGKSAWIDLGSLEGPQGERGPKGDTGEKGEAKSGVYIGEEPPTDEDVKVWIYPTGGFDIMPTMTQSEYDAIPPDDIDNDVLYVVIPDEV